LESAKAPSIYLSAAPKGSSADIFLTALGKKSAGYKQPDMYASEIAVINTAITELIISPANSYIKNIKAERKIIKDFMLKADLVIDTTKTSVKELQKILEKEYSGKKAKLSVNLTSFGFKNGIPLDLHLMFDLRFLPNPYYIEDLKRKTGNHKDVMDYVMGLEESKEFYKMLLDMLEYLIPKYEKDGKSHLRIGIGCSGGQHRSATFVNMLYKDLSERLDYKITKFHREIGDKTEV